MSSDWTQSDGFDPSGDGSDIDNYDIGEVAASNQTADEIAKANAYPEIPPGEQILIMGGFAAPPKEQLCKVILDGQLASYDSAMVNVIFHTPGNPKATVRDMFLLPPADARQMRAYHYGLAIDPKTQQAYTDAKPGRDSNKFFHFIGRLGFSYPAGGKLPAEARRLGNWKGRAIIATVRAAKPYTGKDGTQKDGFPSIKFYSYKPAPNGAVAGGGANTTANNNGASTHAGNGNSAATSTPHGRPATQAAGQLAGVGAGAGASNGLDDI